MVEKQDRPMGLSDKMEDFAEYRPISSLSIISFLIGLVSLGALASMVLWILPIISIVFGLIVLGSIRRADVKPIGQSLAVLAICMSLLVAFWAPTRHFSRMWKLSVMAREYSQEWLELVVVNDNLDRAHGLTKTYGERMLDDSGSAGMGGVGAGMMKKKKKKPSGNAPRAPSPSMEMEFSVEKLFDRHPLSTLLKYAKKGKLEFVKTDHVSYQKAFNAHAVSQRYRFTYTENGEKHVVNVSIVVQREVFDDLKKARWHVKDVKDADTNRSALH